MDIMSPQDGNSNREILERTWRPEKGDDQPALQPRGLAEHSRRLSGGQRLKSSRRRNRSGSGSLGSRILGGFYSSRRLDKTKQRADHPAVSRQGSGESMGSSVGSAWGVDSAKGMDTSPRLPHKRGSLDNTSTASVDDFHSSPQQRRGSDTAPRKPGKRVSIDMSFDHEDICVSPQVSVQSTVVEATEKDIYVMPPPVERRTSAVVAPKELYVAPKDDDVSTSQISDGTSTTEQEIYVSPVYADTDTCSDTSFVTSFSAASAPAASTRERVVPERSPSDNREQEVTPRTSAVFQRTLNMRREESQRSFGSLSRVSSRKKRTPSIDNRWRQRSSRSLGGRSLASTGSRDSCRSMMSCQSHLDLSTKVQTLLEMASDVVNANTLDYASKCYQKTVHAAGSEIMDINIKMSDMQGDETARSKAQRTDLHEDLRHIGIIIGMLRTKMAILYAEDGDYERAIDLCKGASQVHKHQPALKIAQKNLDGVDQLAALMVLIIERLESGQTSLEEHFELLEKIDQYSQRTDFSVISDCDTVFSTKEIVFDMIESVTAKDEESVVSHYDDDTLDLLSVHAAGQDKHDEAIKYLRDALQIHLVALGMKHPRTGEHLLRIAKMYRGKGNNRKNEELVLGQFHQTAAVLERSNLGAKARGAVLNDIAVIHMRRKDFDEAIKFLLDAIHAYDEDAEDIGSGRRPIATLQTWRNLGDCYMQLDRFKSAESAYSKALEIQRDSQTIRDAAKGLQIRALGVDKSLKHYTSDESIADTLCKIGKACGDGGDHKRALDIFKEALTVINRNVAIRGKSDAELLSKRDQLTRTLYCIAEACKETEEYERSLRMYRLSIKVRNSNGAEKKDNRMSSRLHSLKCFIGIGDVYIKTKAFSKALKQFKEAHSYSLASRVKSSHPIAVTIQTKLKETEKARDLALTSCPESTRLEKKADAEIERGALDDAIESLKLLLAMRTATLQELKEKGDDTSEQVYAIACLLQTFGFVFAKNGDDENAERAFKDASRLFRKGGRSGGMDESTRTTL